MTFAVEAASRGCIVVLRLWNEGGANDMNDTILQQIALYQPQPWQSRKDGWKLSDNLFIENDDMFEWPDLERDAYEEEKYSVTPCVTRSGCWWMEPLCLAVWILPEL